MIEYAPTFNKKLASGQQVVNKEIKFQYEAVDLDADPVEYSLKNPPTGATITSDGQFSWTPSTHLYFNTSISTYFLQRPLVHSRSPALQAI
jgi:hypothetical protein